MSDEMSRQQRRRIARDQLKSGRALATTGIAASPKRETMRDVARLMHAKLMERDNPRRAGEAAAIAAGLAEASLTRHPSAVAIACTKGCAFCCYSFVGALPPEIFRISAAVRVGRARGLDAATIALRSARLAGVSPMARVGARLPCPLLVDGLCSVYGERPLTCRQATSLSRDACLEEFEGRGDQNGRIEVSSAHLAHASNANVALLGAMRAANLPTDSFELSSALVIALAAPESERRWLAGEDVFAVLPRNIVRPMVVEQVAAKIAADLTG